jgi:hypothetical protein
MRLHIDAEYDTKTKELIIPVQSDVENIAIETTGLHHNIYFDFIPLCKNIFLKWTEKLKGWKVITK